MPIHTTTDSAALNEVRTTIEALASLKTPLSESADEGERHARALIKQNEAQKLARIGLGSLEKSLFSLASGSKGAGQALAGFAQNFLGDLLKTTLKASITRPLESLLPVAHAGTLVGKPTRLRSYHQGGIIEQSVAHAGTLVGEPTRLRSYHHGGIVEQSVAHAGTLVGEPTRLRSYHQGGIIGQKNDEVPIIAQRGEEILSRGDPRHRANLGASPSIVINVSVQPPHGRTETLQEQAQTIALAVRQGALNAIEQQAERGGNFARAVGRRRA